MHASMVRLLAPLVTLTLTLTAAGCSDGTPSSTVGDPNGTEPEAQASDIKTASCRGIVGTDAIHYSAAEPNVARELAASLASSLVVDGSAFVPGVLRARSSTSPYAYAATLELATWSTMSTTAFDGDATTDGSLVVRMQGDPAKDAGGKAAKALFDAMTNAAQTSEGGAVVRRSPAGSIVCASYPNHVQCALGPLGHVEQTSACPK